MEPCPRDDGYNIHMNKNEFSLEEENESVNFTRFEALLNF
jgi:hypothetical protein